MAMTLRDWSGLLAVADLGVSGYLTATHYFSGSVPLACSSSGLVNCEQVTTSATSMIGPMPVALLGLAWSVVMRGLVAFERPRLRRTLLRLELPGRAPVFCFILYLVYAGVVPDRALCLWCDLGPRHHGWVVLAHPVALVWHRALASDGPGAGEHGVSISPAAFTVWGILSTRCTATIDPTLLRDLSLRAWIDQVRHLHELREVSGASTKLEIGTIVDVLMERSGNPAVLFDQIPGYAPGYRILGNVLTHGPCRSQRRV